jgi:hypothetical protein
MPSATCSSSMSRNRLPKNSALLCFSEGVQSLSDEITPTSFCVPVLKWSALLLLLNKKNKSPSISKHARHQLSSKFSMVLVGISTSISTVLMQTALLDESGSITEQQTVVESREKCLRHVGQVGNESDRRVRKT